MTLWQHIVLGTLIALICGLSVTGVATPDATLTDPIEVCGSFDPTLDKASLVPASTVNPQTTPRTLGDEAVAARLYRAELKRAKLWAS